jgi:predicted MFS family arabinose efflux permease
MLTTLAADWFPGRDLPTAMGVLSASWPGGIALALLALPPAAEAAGWRAAAAGAAAMGLLAAALLLAALPPAPAASAPRGPAAGGLRAREWSLTLLAGLIWGLYNAALVTALSYAPDLLAARGRGPVEAAAAASTISWACLATIALGGWAAARSGRPDLVTALSLLGTAAGLAALGAGAAGGTGLLIAIGLAFGPAAGPVLALAARAARPEARAFAFGAFFALYYAVFGGGPALAGWLRDVSDRPEAPILLSASMLVLALALYAAFRAARPASA